MTNDQLDLIDACWFEKFHLLPAKREPRRERFEDRPATQRPLFIGANDLPGQTYLLDPFEPQEKQR
jgi:hypothetical protein